MILSESHQRSINAVAGLLERKLDDLENSLVRRERNAENAKIAHTFDLTEKQKDEIQHEIDSLHQLLNEFCDHYNVPQKRFSLKAKINTKVSFLWEDLSGAAGKNLTGYGEIAPEVIAEYDRFIGRMIENVNSIIYTINSIQEP
ncbi:MAG: hypothetical protein ACK4S0_00055 [Sediminibacterium sp.]